MEFDNDKFFLTEEEIIATGLPEEVAASEAQEFGEDLLRQAQELRQEASSRMASPINSERAHARELIGRATIMLNLSTIFFRESDVQISFQTGFNDLKKFLADNK